MKKKGGDWEKTFADYRDAARARFSFLEKAGYGEPRIFIEHRECTIVYWGDDLEEKRANLSLFYDLGGPPTVEIIPLWIAKDDGSTRAFGLAEAVPVLAPEHEAEKPEKTSPPTSLEEERAWIEWHAAFLEAHVDALTRPSTELLDAIEARRPSANWWEAYT